MNVEINSRKSLNAEPFLVLFYFTHLPINALEVVFDFNNVLS